MTPPQSGALIADFTNRVARLNDVLSTANALQWDARVMMPRGGAQTRGHQIATLKGIAREMILAPVMEAAAHATLDAVSTVGPVAGLDAPATELIRRAASAVLAARTWHKAIPADLLRRQAEKSALAQAAWAEARSTADFALFRPHLEETISLARQQAEATGYDAHPYDAMVHGFEPGETAHSLKSVFERLHAAQKPILDRALGRPKPRTDFLYRDYPVAQQQAFCHEIAATLGYDFTRGRLDTAVHPFEISFTRNDVRITSRWSPNYLPMALFGTMHETGHALYEQGIDETLTRSAHATDLIGLYAVGGTSFGMHESQSRLFENHVGRSSAFWTRHFGRLRDHFPDQLGDVQAEDFVAAVNRVEPGLIRVEADELTYDFHIMLRVRLEMALMDGSLDVADLPGAWNEAMHADLGLKVPHDGLGCLQDVHWSSGYIGSFATYTIGNLTAAQLMRHYRETRPDVTDALRNADTAPLSAALQRDVWRHGRSRSRTELLADLGCTASDPTDYIAYLSEKFAA